MGRRDEAVSEIATTGADYAADRFHTEFEVAVKSSAIDPVTEIDRETQKRIVSAIEKRFPDDEIVGEEGTQRKTVPENGYAWIIDPIDGTHNYVRGMNEWVTSVAVLKDARPIAAVNVVPRLSETYRATVGGAERDGTPISVSDTTDPASFLVASTLRLHTKDNTKIGILADEVIARFGEFRRIGSAQLTLSLVANGSLDAVVGFEMEPHPWDTVAGAFQIRQAGGTVTDLHGDRWELGRPGIVASNGRVHDDVLDLAQKTFK